MKTSYWLTMTLGTQRVTTFEGFRLGPARLWRDAVNRQNDGVKTVLVACTPHPDGSVKEEVVA